VRGLLNGPKVFYRVVVKRKDSVSGDVPLADVPTSDRVRDLEELRPFEDEPSTPAPPAPSEAPAAPGAVGCRHGEPGGPGGPPL
jgi:hypothetical protein